MSFDQQNEENEPVPQQCSSNQPSTSKIPIKRRLNTTHHSVFEPKMPRTKSDDDSEINNKKSDNIEIPEKIKTKHVEYDEIIARNNAFKELTNNLEITTTTRGRKTLKYLLEHAQPFGHFKTKPITPVDPCPHCNAKLNVEQNAKANAMRIHLGHTSCGTIFYMTQKTFIDNLLSSL